MEVTPRSLSSKLVSNIQGFWNHVLFNFLKHYALENMIFWMADPAFLRVNLNPNLQLFFLKWRISDTISDLSEILFKILIFNSLISFLPQILKKNKELKSQIIKKNLNHGNNPFFPRFLWVLGFWSTNNNIPKVFFYYCTLKWKKKTIFQIWPTLLLTFVHLPRSVFLKMKMFKAYFETSSKVIYFKNLLYKLNGKQQRMASQYILKLER